MHQQHSSTIVPAQGLQTALYTWVSARCYWPINLGRGHLLLLNIDIERDLLSDKYMTGKGTRSVFISANLFSLFHLIFAPESRVKKQDVPIEPMEQAELLLCAFQALIVSDR